MTKQRKISNKEKLEILDAFFFRLNFHRYVSCSESKVHAMLAMADAYVNAHSTHLGTPVQDNVNAVLEAMKELP